MKKLLIIDDNKDFLELMLISLNKVYNCSGFLSLEDFRNNYDKSSFDLMICDYNVCGDEAPYIIQSIKEEGYLKDQPVVVISGSDVNSLNNYDLDNGFYLEKPFRIADLKELLNEIFSIAKKEISNVGL